MSTSNTSNDSNFIREKHSFPFALKARQSTLCTPLWNDSVGTLHVAYVPIQFPALLTYYAHTDLSFVNHTNKYEFTCLIQNLAPG